MKKYRYKLDRSVPTKLHYCPQCGKKELKRYVDTETNEYLPSQVGRCNREEKCGYHFTAKEYFESKGQTFKNHQEITIPSLPPETTYLPEKLLKQSLKKYGDNFFVKYLEKIFPAEVVQQLVQKYEIGTSVHWCGATVFWQRDIKQNIRTGKIMLYDYQTGKRVKHPYNHIQWVHNVLKLDKFNFEQCLFGEHLLSTDPSKTIGIVESEKTAVIACGYLPDFIWLSCGSIHQLTVSKMKVLQNRKVILFPDLGKGFEEWKKQSAIIQSLMKISIYVSDILEKIATDEERLNGLDIADYLINCQYKPPEIPYTASEIILGEMIKKNPEVLTLIETFKLYNPQTSQPYRIKTDI